MALVLIVDDEPAFRFFLRALFEAEGHEALTGRNAEEGLAHVRARKPDLITLDVMMPGHGGLEMYRALNSGGAWRDIPVIMLSGVGADTWAHALAMNGVAGDALPEPYAYVEKPPQPERLLELARPILDRARTPARQRSEKTMPYKVLIVDDDSHIVKYMVDILTDNGYATCSASDGTEALEVLKREKPDLITLDLEMPNEWGPRFYRKMSRDAEFKNLPVIVISGLAGIHLAIQNAVASFKKPFDPNKLLETIRETLEKKETS